MLITVSPKVITQVLTACVLILIVASTAGQFAKYYLGYDNVLGLVGLFYVDSEENIPTWFSSSTLLLSALLLAMIYSDKRRSGDRFALHWGVLSLGFIYLSMDEASRLHEKLGHSLGVPWVVPFAIAGIFILAWYWRFVMHLPPDTRRLFALAGVIYVAGAMGMELVGWKYRDLYGDDHFGWSLVLTLEELLEMMGIITFIYGLTAYMRSYAVEPRPSVAQIGM